MIVFPQGKVPALLPVFHLGFGPDAFIANAGWYPNYTATNLFWLNWLCPSRNPDKAAAMRANLRMAPDNCSHDYASLLQKVFAERGNPNAVVCITTETGYHADHIVAAVEAGARYVIVDKPLVRTLAEFNRVRKAVTDREVLLVLTYNHLFNAPVFQMRRMAREFGVTEVRAWFYQSWLDSNLSGLRQFDWRTDDKLCGLADIGSHAENLASFATGLPLISISKARLGSGGGHGKGNIYTSGGCIATFGDGIPGEITFDQAQPGHRDDIGVCVSLQDGRRLLWRLELGVDNLWITESHHASCFELAGWTRHMRGDALFSGEVNKTFNETPHGHHHGWSSLWRYLFTAAAGAIYRDLGTDLGFGKDDEPPILRASLPGLAAGEQTTRFLAAMVQSFEGGSAVNLADIAA